MRIGFGNYQKSSSTGRWTKTYLRRLLDQFNEPIPNIRGIVSSHASRGKDTKCLRGRLWIYCESNRLLIFFIIIIFFTLQLLETANEADKKVLKMSCLWGTSTLTLKLDLNLNTSYPSYVFAIAEVKCVISYLYFLELLQIMIMKKKFIETKRR